MNNISEISNQEIDESTSQTSSLKIDSNLTKRILLAIIVLVITLFSWTGTVDKASETFIDSSLKQAAIVYGTARAINATVSVLQTVSIPGFGLGVGQALDPLNSIVERFSTIMEISIGSLVIQKILIEITTNSFFNILLTISAITILASVFLKSYLDVKLLVKLFLSLTFLRYAIVISLALNGVISNAFIKDKIDTEANIIINASAEASNDIEKHNEATKEIKIIENQSPKENEKSTEILPPETNATPPLVPQNKGWWAKAKDAVLGQPNTNSTQPVTSDTVEKTSIQKMKDWIAAQRTKFQTVLDNFNPMKIAAKIQKVVQNMINLMAIILLQTLLLPIFFMYLLKWIVYAIWNIRIDNFFCKDTVDKK